MESLAGGVMKLTNIYLSCFAWGISSLAFSTAQAGSIEYNGPKITFEQIYDNPDDNDLKLNYARQQAAAGDLLSAVGALEGMLYSQPNWDSARLFYAVVLYELDDRVAALRELDILDGRPLSSADQKIAARYRQAIADPRPGGTTFSGTLEVGLRVDDNAGNAFADSIIDFADESDVAAIANGSAQVSVPLTQVGRLRFNLGVRGQTRNYFNFTESDFGLLGADLGFSGEAIGLFWGADLKFDNIFIGNEKYLTQHGVKISAGKMITDNTRLTVSGAVYDQDFESISFSLAERFRSGNNTLITASILTQPSEDLSYGASIGYEDKNATQNALAYTGYSVGGHVFKGFDNGVYLKGAVRYRDLNYGATNLFGGTSMDRDDDQLTGRVGVGAGINKIGGWLGMDPNPAFSRVFIETGVDYTDYNSTLSLFEYENIGADLKLIWNF